MSGRVGPLEGARALVVGVANERSIGWAIAKQLRAQGAEIVLTYQGDVFEKRVAPLAAGIGAKALLPCDVTDDHAVEQTVASAAQAMGGIDLLVHAVAYARKEDLVGEFVNTDREGFRLAMDVSVYSLVALARAARPWLETSGRGRILTLSYFGAEKVVPHYNVMGVAKAALEATVRYLAADLGPRGICVNAISAGPIKTLAAAGIRGFRDMMHHHADRSLLHRNVTADEVAATAAALLAAPGAAITGEVVHVDAGYHAVGL